MVSYFVLFAAILATALANVANIKKCNEASDDVCKVTQVRVEPCNNPKQCTFVQGSDAHLSFDFTPQFAASKLVITAYWDNGQVDLPFDEMESNDGCKYTQCPTEAGKSQTLNFNLPIDTKSTPKGKYQIKWKVSNEDNDNQLCCFKTNIEIKKKPKTK